jgi:hypothetical protein
MSKLTTCYLVITRRGVERVTKKVPELRSGQFAVRLRLNLPDNLFKPDVPSIDLTIPPRDVIVPEIIVEPSDPEQPNA